MTPGLWWVIVAGVWLLGALAVVWWDLIFDDPEREPAELVLALAWPIVIFLIFPAVGCLLTALPRRIGRWRRARAAAPATPKDPQCP